MIPILFNSNETSFNNNGLGRLRSCIKCVVSEERNGIYECDFEVPVTAEDFNEIQIGRIIGVTHDDSGDIQPFDIVSYTRPIDGIVSFHAVHISYRLSGQTTWSASVNSLEAAFNLFRNIPNTPFVYRTDKSSTGYLACADGIPRTVRSMLGGIEGSVLDTYGGEYEWDRWYVILHSARGTARDLTIRYGVNMLGYEETLDISGTYKSCVPYWTDGATTVIGNRQDSSGSLVTGRGACVPLDISDKFETKPTKAQVNAMGLAVMKSKNPTAPAQNIHVEFVRLQDLGYEEYEALYDCRLCDTINVVFPSYNTKSRFKIVKTTWNVLEDRYESMELGDLSMSLSEALGISNSRDNNYVMADSSGNVSIGGKLTVGGHTTEIGYRNNDYNTRTVASGNTPVRLTGDDVPVALSAGTWLLIGAADFTANANGVRHLVWYRDGSAMNASRVTVDATSGGFNSRLQSITTVKVDSTANLELYCFQNSGSALSVNWYWQIVRIA